VTHDQEEALELANEVVVMNHGRIEQAGTPDQVYNQPAAPFVAAFVGATNAIRGRLSDGEVHFGSDRVKVDTDLPGGSEVVVYVRPHDIELTTTGAADSVLATVDRRTNLGASIKIHMRLNDGQGLVAHMRNEEANGISPGAKLHATLGNPKAFLEHEASAVSVVEDGVELSTENAAVS